MEYSSISSRSVVSSSDSGKKKRDAFKFEESITTLSAVYNLGVYEILKLLMSIKHAVNTLLETAFVL